MKINTHPKDMADLLLKEKLSQSRI